MGARENKLKAAQAALPYFGDHEVVGIGTGSTVDLLIDLLGANRGQANGGRIRAAVSSSNASTARLRAVGIEVIDLNDSGPLPVYIDGADEATISRHLIKGGGAALTREKIIAQASAQFVCIADDSKLVPKLGTFPLPVEVIPMATSLVARELMELGRPVLRTGVLTDNGNRILDVHGLDITDPVALESQLNQIPGIVTVGLFARRPADVLILAGDAGTRII